MSQVSIDPAAIILPSPASREWCRLGWLGADGKLHRTQTELPFPSQHWSAARSHAVSADWVVGLRPASADSASPQASFLYRARLWWVRGRPRVEPLPEIRISAWQQVNTLLLDGHWLYVGGAQARTYLWQHEPAELHPEAVECFMRYNLLQPDPQPEPIPLPVDFGPGKAIDDLLCHGSELLVVDNVVYPKYLFFYQLRPMSLLPRWRRTHQLPFSRTYERIRGGEWNNDFIALLSSSMGMGGSAYYVSVLRRSDLKPVLLLATYYMRRISAAQRATQAWAQLEGVALQGTMLLVACGTRGLARLQLSATSTWPKQRTYFTTYTWEAATDTKAAWWRARRGSAREWAPALDLTRAGSIEGVEWLPPPTSWRAISTVRFVGPGQVLLGYKRRVKLLQLR